MKRSLITFLFLCYVSLGWSQSPSFDWARQICNNQSNDYYDAMGVDNAGNVVGGGRFSYTIDFDPGLGTLNLSPQGSIFNVFLQKLDAQGNLVWALQFEDSGSDEDLMAIQMDAQNNVYVMLRLFGTVDLDPGTGVQTMNLPNGGTVLVKLDPAGNYVWSRLVGEGSWNKFDPADLTIAPNGDFYITGMVNDSVDVDPSAAQNWLVGSGANGDAFLLKYDGSGNYLFARGFPTSINSVGYSVRLDGQNNVWLGGSFRGVVDFTGGMSTLSSTSNNYRDAFIVKLSGNGTTLFTRAIAGFYGGYISDMEVDTSGVYAVGPFRGSFDFDPGPNFATWNNGGNKYNGYLVKLDLNGDFQWVEDLGNSGSGTSSSGFPRVALGPFSDLWIANNGTSSPFSRVVKYDPASGNQLWDSGSLSFDVRHLDLQGAQLYAGGFFRGTRNFHPNGTYDLMACAPFGAPSSQQYDAFLFKWKDCANTFDTLQAVACGSYLAPWGQVLTSTGSYTDAIPNAVGCDSVITLNLTVFPFPMVSGGPDQSVCEGDSVTLSASGAWSYTWDQGIVDGQSFLPVVSGSYVVSGIDTNGCEAWDTVAITVNVIPSAMIAVNSDHLSASPSGLSYQWLSCDSVFSIVSGATQQDYYPTASGSYAVVVDGSGCQDTSACEPFVVVGLVSQQITGPSLWPNPAAEQVNLRWEAGSLEIVKWKVTDVWGREFLAGECMDCSRTSLDLSGLAAGLYFVDWQMGNERQILQLLRQ